MNNRVILTKGQDVSALTDSTAILINKYTDVVNQLANALEDNTGNDVDAIQGTASTWYNEAFDGIYVLVGKSTVTTGIWDSAKRETVWDVKLTPDQTSKSDLGTEFYKFRMRTSSCSDSCSVDDVLCNFMGVNAVPLQGNHSTSRQYLNNWFITNTWYSTNITT